MTIRAPPLGLLALAAVILSAGIANASSGDRLPEFRDCVSTCIEANCELEQTAVSFHHRLLFWDCPSECDYVCQHIVTDARLAHDPPYHHPVHQFHGKWPFWRFFGIQEPFSVIFSLFNYLAHDNGIQRLREHVPASYPLRKYYIMFGYVGLASWIFSIVFHTRDFVLTEKLDYFAAGANVLYTLYYTPIRVWRLDKPTPRRQSVLRAWTLLCILLYTAHVTYLSLWKWDYTYNMAANVAAGVISNLMWSYFSIVRYKRLKRVWAAWPGLIVAWLIMAMSLELFDFPPWGRMLDAHSLWHLATVVPTIWMYSFLIKDAKEDLHEGRMKL